MASRSTYATTLACQSKMQKLNEEQGWNGCKHIEDLPDSILNHILSFLSTKDAVATSVLSKKWQYMWTTIPNLHFREGDPTKRKLFTDFVERVLLLHDFSSIKSFHLECHVFHDASRVNAWITAAVRKNVQEVSVFLRGIDESFTLPHCLFSCSSLAFLDLNMPCMLKLPPSVNFSSLRLLSLVAVAFSDNQSTQQLLSGPVLEELTLKNCDLENLIYFRISAPKLWSLNVIERSLSPLSSSNGCEVLILGTNITHFLYVGELFNRYSFCDLSSVVEASIDVYISELKERVILVAHLTNKLIRGLHHVKDLSLSSRAIEILDIGSNILEEYRLELPMFENLSYLKIDCEAMNCDCDTLMSILQNSPRLKTLEFEEGVRLSCEKDDGILDTVPPCFLSHLKVIKIGNFEGHWDELYIVKKLLNRAAVLDWMDISFSEHLTEHLNNQKRVCELLLELPRKSESCIIFFPGL